MKKFLVLLMSALACSASSAARLDHEDSASAWLKATGAEKNYYAASIEGKCRNSACNAGSIVACLNEAIRRPLPQSMQRMRLVEAAATCMMLIESGG